MYKAFCIFFLFNISLFVYSQSEDIQLEKKKKEVAILTFGFFEGGGLVGLNAEYLIYKNFGIQAGLGLLGYEAALNFHFKDTIRSSYFSLQYINQGFDQYFVQSIIVGSCVFRGKKNLSTRIGLGLINELGPKHPYKKDLTPNFLLMFSIGMYVPIIR